MIIRALFFAFLLNSTAFAQISQNVSLFGTLDPEPIHYAGCWGYTNVSGEEYALLGAYTYTSIISIDDSTNITEVAAIPGPSSNWREITVIGDYAYVVSEGTDTLTGMQVIDLSNLPNSATVVATFDSTFTASHMVQKDVLGDPNYVYVSGGDQQTGVHIIDVSNPLQPVEVGFYNPNYAHDAHVRGDTMYVAAILQPWMDIVDISNKSNPVLIGQIIYPGAFTHSCWTTRDNTHLFVCDEQDGLLGKVFDIRDLGNISLVATYSADTAALVHNVYIKEDFAFITHNTEGLRILDMVKPAVPVEVGYYDTWPGAAGGFNGLWSACPFYPSGKIIGGNRHDGLYVWRFNETFAGRIYGEVVDSVSGFPISQATVEITQSGASTNTNFAGLFGFGEVPGTYTMACSAPGYLTKTVANVQLNGLDSLWYRFELASDPNALDEAILAEIKVGMDVEEESLRVILTEGLGMEGLEFAVYDVRGRRVLKEKLAKNGDGFVPFGEKSNGVYVWRLADHEGVLKVGKLIWAK